MDNHGGTGTEKLGVSGSEKLEAHFTAETVWGNFWA